MPLTNLGLLHIDYFIGKDIAPHWLLELQSGVRSGGGGQGSGRPSHFLHDGKSLKFVIRPTLKKFFWFIPALM